MFGWSPTVRCLPPPPLSHPSLPSLPSHPLPPPSPSQDNPVANEPNWQHCMAYTKGYLRQIADFKGNPKIPLLYLWLDENGK